LKTNKPRFREPTLELVCGKAANKYAANMQSSLSERIVLQDAQEFDNKFMEMRVYTFQSKAIKSMVHERDERCAGMTVAAKGYL
jgi:hypothetical protein